MSAQKHQRIPSPDRLLRLLPDCKRPKLQQVTSPAAVPLGALAALSIQREACLSIRTEYHAAVDLARMSKTAVAYYTARKAGEIASDRLAAKACGKKGVAKCGSCSKPLDDEGGIQCTGKCNRRCHPSCGVLMERRDSALRWICLKCAGVPRP